MAQIIDGVSRTFNEFLLLPNRTRTDCTTDTVDLRTPLARHAVGEEGVDGFVPYAGDLNEGLATTVAKIKATMVSCGAASMREFRETARLTIVSAQSIEESHATVTIRDTPASLA